MMKRFFLGLLIFAVGLVVTGCAANGKSAFATYEHDENFVGRYVGGGKHFGHGRRRDEGIWGRDFAGLDVLGGIELRWSRSRSHRQGGVGSY